MVIAFLKVFCISVFTSLTWIIPRLQMLIKEIGLKEMPVEFKPIKGLAVRRLILQID